MKKYLLNLLIISQLCFFACSTPKKELKAEDEIGDVQLIDYDCHNCGMPSDSPEWSVALKEKKGEEIYYCSPRCFLTVYTDEKNRPQDILSIEVRDYTDKQKFPAEKAWFVIGSGVKGPMGIDIVPHKTQDAAEKFKNETKARQILKLNEFTAEIVKQALNK
ncbi:MAG: nitrous oxide reductase accessory protein NosL [Microscillaceae bacterium]|jgi:nitrous oxide reductase accessory protein NosL|nr:nitrous oxide reductase accessory protein NosL [Microscillaceae bacterium]